MQAKVIPIRKKGGRPVVTQGFPKMVVKLPPELYAWVRTEATENLVSMNAVAVRCIRDAMNKRR